MGVDTERDLTKNFAVFDGLDISKSEGKMVSLITLNGDLQRFNGNSKSDLKMGAFTVFHEIAAHVLLYFAGNYDGNRQHVEFGHKTTNGPHQQGSLAEMFDIQSNKYIVGGMTTSNEDRKFSDETFQEILKRIQQNQN